MHMGGVIESLLKDVEDRTYYLDLRDCYLSCRLVGLVLQIVDLNCIALEYSF